jgi:hypothetical protein
MSKDPGRTAVIILSALVGHELGDYIVQTNHQASNKGADGYNPPDCKPDLAESWKANQLHCAGYHAALAATVGASCAFHGIALRPRNALAALALSWGTHAVIDRRWPVEKLMNATGSSDYYPVGAPAVDQALHKLVILVAGMIASR